MHTSNDNDGLQALQSCTTEDMYNTGCFVMGNFARFTQAKTPPDPLHFLYKVKNSTKFYYRLAMQYVQYTVEPVNVDA